MKRTLFATCLLGAMALAGAASAQTADDDTPVGKQAGTLMVRLRAIGVIPEDSSSSVSPIGGHVDVSSQAAPEVDFSYFFTDNIAAELIAATTRHDIQATGTALGNVSVGTAWVLPPTVTLQYHFFPRERFSPYIGAGLNVSFFYDTSPSKPIVQSFSLDNSVGAALQVGFDYNFSGHWFANVDVKQIFVSTTAHINTLLGPVTARTALNPLVIGAGIGYRF
jgi:outer membrane protein